MSDMNSKKNQLEERTAETLETSKKGGVNKWVWVGLALLAFIGGFGYVQLKPEPLQLEHLVEGVEYQLLDVVQADDETIVDIGMTENEEAVVEVVKAIVEEVKANKSYHEGDRVKVEVFESLENPEVKPGLESDEHTYTGVYEETLKLYQLKDFSDVEANILATDHWKIEDSKYEAGHLTGRVVLLEEHEEAVIFSQLKALESEMTRFNEVAEDKDTYFYTPQVDQISYGYSSVYPQHLIIEKEVIVTQTK